MQQIEDLGRRVAAELVATRKRSGLTQTDIVSKTSGLLSRSYVRKMETAGSSPTIRTLHLYLSACGVTLGEFFEPWLPKDDPERYDSFLHRVIKQALRHRKTRAYVESFVEMLRSNLPE